MKVDQNYEARGRVAQLFSAFIFYALLAVIALAAIPYGTVQPWWQSLFECAVFALAAFWLMEGFLGGSWNIKAYALLWPLLALAIFGWIQTLPLLARGGAQVETLKLGGDAWRALSADPHGTRQWVSKMLALILTGAMLLRYTSSRRRLRALVSLVVGIALASAIFGLLRQMMQHQPDFILPYLKQGFGYGQFVNKNHFAFLMEMAFGLVLGLALWGGMARERRLVCLGAALLFGGALVLANSRGGIFALVCQLLFSALLFSVVRPVRDSTARESRVNILVQQFGRSLLVRALLVIGLALIITAGIFWVGGDPLVGSLEAMPTEVGAPAEGIRWAVRRRDIWPATWRLIEDHPLAGTGFGGYWMAITAYHDASGEKTPQEAHNDYLEFLAGGGLLGGMLGLWFVYAFVREARLRLLRASDSFGRAARCGALTGLCGIAAHSFVDFGLHVTINAALFIVLTVIATAADISSRRAEAGTE